MGEYLAVAKHTNAAVVNHVSFLGGFVGLCLLRPCTQRLMGGSQTFICPLWTSLQIVLLHTLSIRR